VEHGGDADAGAQVLGMGPSLLGRLGPDAKPRDGSTQGGDAFFASSLTSTVGHAQRVDPMSSPVSTRDLGHASGIRPTRSVAPHKLAEGSLTVWTLTQCHARRRVDPVL
jgi:hypothetical protein